MYFKILILLSTALTLTSQPCQKQKPFHRENGWYHVSQRDNCTLSDAPIVTVKGFASLQLEHDYYGKYAIVGQLDSQHTHIWTEETGKAVGQQIAFVFNDSVITSPKVNCAISSGTFMITSVNDQKLKDIFHELKQEMDTCTTTEPEND